MHDFKGYVRERLSALRGIRPEREAAIVEELAQHLDDCYEELLAGGASEAEAYRVAALNGYNRVK